MNKLLLLGLVLIIGCGKEVTQVSLELPYEGPKPNPAKTTYSLKEDGYITVFSDTMRSNTGITFDTKTKLLVHSKYVLGAVVDGRDSALVFTTKKGDYRGELSVSQHIDHIQGISYRPDHDSFLIWGTKVGLQPEIFTNNFLVVEVDKLGALKGSWELAIEDNYPGAIYYIGNGLMWAKANTKAVATLYELGTTAKIMRTFDTRTGGEGIAVDEFGNIWSHGDCKLRGIDKNGFLIFFETISPFPHCNEEGLVFDDEGALWVSANEGSHEGLTDWNRAYRYVRVP